MPKKVGIIKRNVYGSNRVGDDGFVIDFLWNRKLWDSVSGSYSSSIVTRAAIHDLIAPFNL